MSETDEQIPEEAFREFGLRFSRHIAIAILVAVADGGATMETIDKRLGRKRGWAMSVIAKLVENRQMKIDPIADVMWAAGGYVIDWRDGTPRARKVQLREPDPPSPSNTKETTPSPDSA